MKNDKRLILGRFKIYCKPILLKLYKNVNKKHCQSCHLKKIHFSNIHKISIKTSNPIVFSEIKCASFQWKIDYWRIFRSKPAKKRGWLIECLSILNVKRVIYLFFKLFFRCPFFDLLKKVLTYSVLFFNSFTQINQLCFFVSFSKLKIFFSFKQRTV